MLSETFDTKKILKSEIIVVTLQICWRNGAKTGILPIPSFIRPIHKDRVSAQTKCSEAVSGKMGSAIAISLTATAPSRRSNRRTSDSDWHSDSVFKTLKAADFFGCLSFLIINKMTILRFLKEWTLPSAIVFGTLMYFLFAFVPALDEAADTLGQVFDVVFPFCVFLTLFTTFAKVDFHKMRLTRWQLWLVVAQLILTALTVGVVELFGISGNAKVLIEAMLTCVIAPCATAAPVVTGKLGGNINTMTTYTLISSLLCALTIPAVFPMLEHVENVTFISASLTIMEKLVIVMLLPLFLGWFVRHYVRKLYDFIIRHPNLSFYLWAVSLAITTGVTVKNICHSTCGTFALILIALLSFMVCLLHFIIGRGIGAKFNEKINCGQGMFQKNTAMAIWVSYMYLSPVASIGAGCYVLWQNIINSWEIAEAKHKTT